MTEEREERKVRVEEQRLEIEKLHVSLEPEVQAVNTANKFWELKVRTNLTLNGGAALALLTFIGHRAEGNASVGRGLAIALLAFGLGAASSGGASLLGYFALRYGARDALRRSIDRYNLPNADNSGKRKLLWHFLADRLGGREIWRARLLHCSLRLD